MSTSKVVLGLGLATAIGTISTAANAGDVKVYGKAMGAVANFQTSEADQSGLRFVAAGSRFGVKAEEKVSDSLTAFAKFEYGVDLTGTKDVLSQRNQFMGLKTNLGTLSMGFQDTPYKKAKSELFSDTFADQNSLLSKGVERRGENAISFKTKEMAGLTLFAQYSDTEQSKWSGSKSAASVSLTYKMKPVTVMLAHENIGIQDYEEAGVTVEADDVTASKLVVKAGFGATKVGLTYEVIDDTQGDTSTDRTNMALNVAHRMGEWEAGLEHVIRSESAIEDAKDGASMTTLAGTRHLNDKFSYYVMVSSLTNDEGASYSPKVFPSDLTKGTAKEAYTTAGVGMILKF